MNMMHYRAQKRSSPWVFLYWGRVTGKHKRWIRSDQPGTSRGECARVGGYEHWRSREREGIESILDPASSVLCRATAGWPWLWPWPWESLSEEGKLGLGSRNPGPLGDPPTVDSQQ